MTTLEKTIDGIVVNTKDIGRNFDSISRILKLNPDETPLNAINFLEKSILDSKRRINSKYQKLGEQNPVLLNIFGKYFNLLEVIEHEFYIQSQDLSNLGCILPDFANAYNNLAYSLKRDFSQKYN